MTVIADEQRTDWAEFRHGPSGGITLMQAHFTEHCFERHSHDTYSIGITLSGVQTFTCRGARHASRLGDVILFNPDEPHDGSRGSDEGFGYSILYVEPALMHAWLDRSAGTGTARYFRNPVVSDRRAAQVLYRAIAATGQQQESLRAEELTSAAIIDLLKRYGEGRADASGCIDAGLHRMNMVREYIDAHFADNLTVDVLARQAGLSRVHLTRAFTKTFGVPPHVYLNMVRLRRAQGALLKGQSLADAAVAAGFADQSHLNRRFRGSMGLSPGAWLKQMNLALPQT
jgi:AraC-like DNA-binding protein